MCWEGVDSDPLDNQINMIMIRDMNKFKYHSGPCFSTLSWAIAYQCGSQDNSKFYRQCPEVGEGTSYLYSVVQDEIEEGNLPEATDEELVEFDVVKTFELDGVTYVQFKPYMNAEEQDYLWSHIEQKVENEV